MSDLKKYLAKAVATYQGTYEEKTLADLLFDDALSISMGDQRLNAIAALTYNTVQCHNIFNLLVKSLNAQDYPWKTLYKALMVVHTIVLFGSEIAVDSVVRNSVLVLNLSSYNSAMVSKTSFVRSAGGTDFGAPVRMQASMVLSVIETDASIRKARSDARAGQDSLVPIGTDTLLDFDMAPPPPNLSFGQGVEKSIGAGFDLLAVPGMYENRPERYFDNDNDVRKPKTTGDHQFTREAMNPDSLLDLAFGGDAVSNDHLPAADYLPALVKQKELEALLAQQQEQLRMLQAMQQQAPAQHGYGAQAQFDSFQSMTTPSSAPSYAPANPSHYSNNSATNFGDLVGHPSASAHAYGSSYGQPPPPMMVGYGYGSGHPASQAAPGVYGSPAPAGYPPQMGYATQPMQPYQYHSGPSTMPPSGMGYGGPHNARHPY